MQIAISDRFKEGGTGKYKYITIQFLKKDSDVYYIENPSKNVICNKDDVLLTRTGNTGIVITDVEGVFHNNFFLIDYNREKVSKYFLKYYFENEPVKKLILAKAGTTTIPDLNHGDFYSIPFIYPDILEQKKIENVLLIIDIQLNKNKVSLEKLQELKKGLMQDLLTGKVRVCV